VVGTVRTGTASGALSDMSINLNDFLGLHLVWLWLILAVLLAALELLRRDRTMARLALCSLAAALVALIFTHLWWLQLTAFVASVVGSSLGAARRRPLHAPAQDVPTDEV
jgi:membrane protein implicated in regulation of membrane protease activity